MELTHVRLDLGILGFDGYTKSRLQICIVTLYAWHVFCSGMYYYLLVKRKTFPSLLYMSTYLDM